MFLPRENESKSFVMVAQPKKKIQKVASTVFKQVMVTGAQCKLGSLAGKPFHSARNVSGVLNRKFCLNRKCPKKSSISNVLCPGHQWRSHPKIPVWTPFSNFSTIYLLVSFGLTLFLSVPLEVRAIAFFSLRSTFNLLSRFSLAC